MEPFKTHGAALPQQNLTRSVGGCPPGPRPEDLMQGGHEGANPHVGRREACEAADQAAAGTLHPSGVTANMQGDELFDGFLPSTSQDVNKADRTATGIRHGEVATADELDDDGSGPGDTKTLTRLDVFKIITGTKKELPLAERVQIVLSSFGDNYTLSPSKEDFASILSKFLYKSESMYKNCKYNMKFFTKKHQDWLSEVLISGHLKRQTVVVDTVLSSPKSKMFLNLSTRQQLRSRRRLESVLEEQPKVKKVKAFINSLSSIDGERLTTKATNDLESVINECLKSKAASTIILKKISNSPQPYTPQEALAIVIDRKITVETYNFLHLDLQDRGFSAFPPYNKVLEARKPCYPNEIQISEREASVPLQSLLQHTLERILQYSDEVVSQYCDQKSVEQLYCIYRGQWGFDGSSGQSLYKQAFKDGEGGDESNLFATTFVPLQLVVTNQKDVIWTNPNPQSYRFCRPLHIQYRKESTGLILSEKNWVESQINSLAPLYSQTSEGQKIKVTCELYFTAIDGKVLNAILNTSSQMRCPYCGLTASDFNNLDIAFNKQVNQETIRHGLSPLHAWIRTLEFLLRLAYKNEVKKWRIKKNSDEGRLVDERKKVIQDEVRNKLGLLVDVVRPNSGTTNDGNSARTALSDKNRQVFAEILNLEKWLLDDLHIILVVLSSGLHINPEKFYEHCKALAQKYIATYAWHPMTVTLHKILVHGADIIRSTTLPIGMLSEQAAETRNKYWRHDREHHTRKQSRELTMTDLFHRAFESSDPVVSSIRFREKAKRSKHIPLPAAAVALLQPASIMVLNVSEPEILHDEEENIILEAEDL